MRISGGEWRGRNVRVPKGDEVRPTQDRVREALFSMLTPALPGAKFLDLFAGSGGVGLEALSRGAAKTTFVELSARHLALLCQNVEALGAQERSHIVRADVYAYLSAVNGEPCDIAFADPPYELGAARGYARMLVTLAERNIVKVGGLFIAEMTSHQKPDLSSYWMILRNRVYGQTRIAVYRRLSEDEMQEIREMRERRQQEEKENERTEETEA